MAERTSLPATLGSSNREQLIEAIRAKELEIQQKQQELSELKQLLDLLPDNDSSGFAAPQSSEANPRGSQGGGIMASLKSLGASSTQSRASDGGESFISANSHQSSQGGGAVVENRPDSNPVDPIMASIRAAQQKSAAEKDKEDPIMASIRAAQRVQQGGDGQPRKSSTIEATPVADSASARPVSSGSFSARSSSSSALHGGATSSNAPPVRSASTDGAHSNGSQVEAFKGSANVFQQMSAAFHRATSMEDSVAVGREEGGPRTWTGLKAGFLQQGGGIGGFSRTFSAPNAAAQSDPDSDEESSSEQSLQQNDGHEASSQPASPSGARSPTGSRLRTEPLTLFEFVIHLRKGRREYRIVADIRWDLSELRRILAEEYEMVFQGTDDGEGCWASVLHGIDLHGDVTIVSSVEIYDEFKNSHLQRADHADLPPMELAILEKGEDVLSLVKIPAGEHCLEPMPWKQGKLLGKGAFGSVHMAMKGDGEIIAVKRIETKAGAELLESFQTESKLLQKLKHKNVVRFIGSKVVAESLAAIWMEYVPGGSVANILQVFGAISEDLVRHYTKQILLGLEYLHGASVIHRDLKPGNILVTVDGVVKLSDFGASVQASITKGEQQFAMAGTPNYIAPEMLRSGPANVGYSFNIDIWSLGMTVIEMLTAQMPFDDQTNPFAVMFQIAKLEEPPEIPSHFSDEAKSFLNRCLQTDPGKRPGATKALRHTFVGGAGDEEQELEAKKVPSTPGGRMKRVRALRRSANNVFASTGKDNVTRAPSQNEDVEMRVGSDSNIPTPRSSEAPDQGPRRYSVSSMESSTHSVSSDEAVEVEKSGQDSQVDHAESAIMFKNKSNGEEQSPLARDPSSKRSPTVDAMRRYNSEARISIPRASPEPISTSPSNSVPATVEAAPISTVGDKDQPPNKPIPTPPTAPMLKSQSERVILSDPPKGKRSSQNRVLEPAPPTDSNTWQFYDHKEWKDYSEMHSQLIETGFLQKIDKVDLILATDSKWGTQYTVDLKGMEQINIASGHRRAVRRVVNGRVDGDQEKPSRPPKLLPDSNKNVDVGVIPTTMEQLTSFLRQKASVEHEAAKGLKGSFRHVVKRIVGTGEAAHKKKLKTVADLQQQVEVLKNEMDNYQGAQLEFIQKRYKKASEQLNKATMALDESNQKLHSNYGGFPFLGSPETQADTSKPADEQKKAPWKASRNFHQTVKAPGVARPVSTRLSLSNLPPEALEAAQLVPSAMVLPGGLYEGWEVVCGMLIGNAYNGPVTHSSPTNMGGKDTVLHSWTVFVRSQEGKSLSLVRKVAFTFWPLKSSQATTELTSEPFAIKRCSSAAFDVSIEIQMQGKKRFKVLHYLCLTKSGEWSDDRNSTESDCFPVTKYVLCVRPGSVPI